MASYSTYSYFFHEIMNGEGACAVKQSCCYQSDSLRAVRYTSHNSTTLGPARCLSLGGQLNNAE